MASSSAAVSHAYTDAFFDSRTVEHVAQRVDPTDVILKGVAVAAALYAATAQAIPTWGVARSVVNDAAIAGDPPDLASLLPWSWVNTVTTFAKADVAEAPLAAIAELRRLRSYNAGWNGPRSKAAVPKSFDAAEAFVKQLITAARHDITVTPTIFAHGTAAVEIEGPTFEALLEFDSAGDMFGAVDTPDESFEIEAAFGAGELPKALFDYL